MIDLTKLSEAELREHQHALTRVLRSAAEQGQPLPRTTERLADVHTELTRRGLYVL